MNPAETQTAMRTSRSVRFFSSHEEQEAETFRYWSSRTIDQRLEVLGELLRSPLSVELDSKQRTEVLAMPSARTVRLFKDREEQEAWNEQRRLHGKRP